MCRYSERLVVYIVRFWWLIVVHPWRRMWQQCIVFDFSEMLNMQLYSLGGVEDIKCYFQNPDIGILKFLWEEEMKSGGGWKRSGMFEVETGVTWPAINKRAITHIRTVTCSWINRSLDLDKYTLQLRQKIFSNLDKYILQFGQVPSPIWTKTLSSLEKYFFHFGQIHFAVWTNTFSNLDKYKFMCNN